MVRKMSSLTLHLCLLFFITTVVPSAYGTDGQIKLTQPGEFPLVIDRSGSYVLTCNITVPTNVNGIEINADNVTLTLNGHTLIGPGKENSSSGNGIYASSRQNIFIINGAVQDFGASGIMLTGTNHQVKDLRVSGNGLDGISAASSTIRDCTASLNGSHGIVASDSAITDCVTHHNEHHGIYAASSTISNCTASLNGSHGIVASNATIVNCIVYNSGGRGMHASDSTITSCTVNHNGSHGIYASSGCRMESNNLRNNGGYGIYLSSSYNYAIKNAASANVSGNFYGVSNNYLPTSGDNANYGW